VTTSGAPARGPLVALALALAVIVAHARVVAGGGTWSDVRYHAEVAPPRFAASDAVLAGEAPAWWDGSGLGVPLLAEPSHGALYPPMWIAATPRLLDLVMVAHLWWAALGVAVWARRRLGASDASALVAGLLVATSGVLASAAVRGSLVALAHLPWLALVAGGLAAAGSRRDRARCAAGLGVLVGAIALTGELVVLVDALAIALAVGARRGALPWLAGGLAAGLAIGLPQWLPAIASLASTAGGEVHGIPLGRLVELIVPGAFGASDSEHGVAAIAGTAAWAPSLFVGAPLLALATVRPPARRLAFVVGGFAIAALVVGRGGWPAWLGAPELHVAALAIVLAANAAAGLDVLVAGERRALIAVGIGAACTAVALGALGALRASRGDAVAPIFATLLDGGLGVACTAGALYIAATARDRTWITTTLVLALIALPSAGAVPLVAPTMDRAVVDDRPMWAEAATRVSPPRRLFRPVFLGAEANEPDIALATLAGASASRWDIAAARSEDPARPAVFDRVIIASSRGAFAFLDRYGIALAILPLAVAEPQHMTILGRRGISALVELPVAPAAYVAHTWRRAVAPDDALSFVFPADGGRGVSRDIIVLAEPGDSHDSKTPFTPCAIDRWDPGDIALTCTTDADAYAVVSSTASPGWTVTIDGDDAHWVTADLLRRAVAIPRGTHAIVWRYRAPGFRIGLGCALLGVLALAGLVVANRR
jgi:hypothetical protein